jgi:hypothetical protein
MRSNKPLTGSGVQPPAVDGGRDAGEIVSIPAGIRIGVVDADHRLFDWRDWGGGD